MNTHRLPIGRAIALVCWCLPIAALAPWSAAAPAATKSGPQVEAARAALRTHQAARAAALLQASADGGDPEAQYLLGLLYQNGVGVAVDASAAQHWLRAAAQQDHAAAAYVLAALLQPQPQAGATTEAAMWLQRSATLGYERARQALKDPRPLLAAEREHGDARARSAWVIYCARHNDAPALRSLGAEAAAARDEFGRGALSHAADAAAAEAVSALLAVGADPRAVDQYRTTALMLAAQRGSAPIVRALLAAGVDVNQADEQQRIALFYAVRSQQLEAVQILLGAGANIGATDARGYSALDIALAVRSDNGADQIASLLRERGAKQSISAVAHDAAAGRIDAARPGQRYAGWSALALAVSHNDQATAQSLLKAGANPDQRTPQGDPLWRLAMDAKAPEMLRLLLAAGADPGLPDHSKHTALVIAAAADDGPLELLLSAGVPADAHAAGEDPPLLAASAQRHLANVRLLLDAKARVDSTDELGRTALMLAAANGDEPLVQLLLAHHAAIGIRDKLQRHALWYAADAGAQSLLEPLLAGNDATDAADAAGTTPLAIAARSDQRELVLRLINAGARVNATDRNGDSPLMLAASAGHADVVAALLAHGAQIDLANSYGDTALMVASRAGALAVCTTLLHAGASRTVRNTMHATAGDVARQRGFTAVAQLLEGRS